MPRVPIETLLRIAYHEAAHAVIAEVLGFSVVKITTKRRRNRVGSAHYIARMTTPGFSQRDRDRMHKRRCVVALAGQLAEQNLLFRLLSAPGAWEGDTAVLYEHFFQIEPPVDLEKLRKATRRLVLRHRAGIERIAEALVLYRELNRQEFMFVQKGLMKPADIGIWRESRAIVAE